MDTKDAERRAASISFRQLELFAATGELGGIQRAAIACGLSQPGATQALALLQDKTAVMLLERGLTGAALTPLGRLFHARIVQIIDGVEAAIASLGAEMSKADARAFVRRVTPAQLRTLAGVLETGSIEGAAHAHGLTREGLRRSAGALEKYVGPLFVRTVDGTRFTPEGERFARRVTALQREVALGIREIHAKQMDATRGLVVGAAQAFGNRLLARVLVELAAEHPDARITVLREGPVKLVSRLRVGEVDLVVGDIGETGPDLVKQRLVATPYFIFGRPGHPLSQPDAIAVEQLGQYDWVGGTPGSVREKVWQYLFAGEILPRVAFAASEGAVVGHFVAGSDRLALMTEHESRCGGLALAKLPFPPLDSGLGIEVVHHADRTPTELQLGLIELLRAHLIPDTGVTAPSKEWRAA